MLLTIAVGPMPGKMWLVLAGKINHVTGTPSLLTIRDKDGGTKDTLAMIAAGGASGSWPIYETDTDANATGYTQVQWVPRFMSQGDNFYLSGGANASAEIQILEFDLAW